MASAAPSHGHNVPSAAAPMATMSFQHRHRGELNDTLLMKLSQRLCNNLFQLDIYLRIDHATSEAVRGNYSKPVEKAFYTLKAWRDSRGRQGIVDSMFEDLCGALSSLNKEELLDDIRCKQIEHFRGQLHRTKERKLLCMKKCNEQVRRVKEEGREQSEQMKQSHLQITTKLQTDLSRLAAELTVTKSKLQQAEQNIQCLKKEKQDLEKKVKSLKKKINDNVSQSQASASVQCRPKTKAAAATAVSMADQKRMIIHAAKPVEGESQKETTHRALEVLRLLHINEQPELLRDVTQYILKNGHLDVTCVFTRDHLGDLVYAMVSGVADFKVINLGGDFSRPNQRSRLDLSDVSDVTLLCQGLKSQPGLRQLGLCECHINDEGFHLLTETLLTNCDSLEMLGCWFNDVTLESLGDAARLLRRRRQLTLELSWCRLSTESCDRLTREFDDRVWVFNQRPAEDSD